LRANWRLIAGTVGVHSYFISGQESFFITLHKSTTRQPPIKH